MGSALTKRTNRRLTIANKKRGFHVKPPYYCCQPTGN
jgi:hypothetical protein